MRFQHSFWRFRWWIERREDRRAFAFYLEYEPQRTSKAALLDDLQTRVRNPTAPRWRKDEHFRRNLLKDVIHRIAKSQI